MHILVYGANGWIGSQFIAILNNNNIKYNIGTSRVNNYNDIINEITIIKPSHVISFIGRTHGTIGDKVYATIDYLEQEGKLVENIRDNLYSPLLLALICKNNGIHYTYLGTGCIFKYDDDHVYGNEINGFTEESLPNFFGSSYSIVKGYTDMLMHHYDNVLNLRIRMPITGLYNKRNFITKITEYEYICSVPNSMTVLPELLPYVLDMMKKQITGTINLTNPGLISHNEILELYKEIVDNDFTWKNFSQEEQKKILAADRSNNYLDTSKLTNLYPNILHIKDAVIKCLHQYKQSINKTIVNETIINGTIVNNINNRSVPTNLLITGGCGFIGSNFINYYYNKNKNVKIINLDALYYSANIKNINSDIRNSDRYIFIKGNICSKDLVKYILDTHHIDHVIHFAAQSHVQKSFDNPLQFTKDNILGAHILLEECRLYGKIKKFIYVSTDEVYGESMHHDSEVQKTENSILCPTNPYAATKASADLMAQSYYYSYKFPIIITRGNNVYGPNQYPEKIIPKFIELLKANKKVTIQGDGSAMRAFMHAMDTARAFEVILENGEIGEIYNIGCDDGTEYTVMDIAKKIIFLIKNTTDCDKWIEYIEDRPFNDKRYYINNSKLKKLGWVQEIKFDDGIRQLI